MPTKPKKKTAAPPKDATPEELEAIRLEGDLREQVAEAKRMGRPLKLTPAVSAAIAASVRRGNYLETAARLSGISKASVYVWITKGHAQKRGLFRDFLDAIERAQAAFEDAALTRLDVADRAEGAGRWTAWRLERMFPERWAAKTVIQEVAQAKTDQEIRALLERIRDRVDPSTYRTILEAIDDSDGHGSDAPTPAPTPAPAG